MTDHNPDDAIAEALRRDGYDPDYDVRRSTRRTATPIASGIDMIDTRRPVRAPVDDDGGPWIPSRNRRRPHHSGQPRRGQSTDADRGHAAVDGAQVRDNLIVMINTIEQLVAADAKENRAHDRT